MKVAEGLASEREESKKRKKAATHQAGSRHTKCHDQREASRMQGKDEKDQVEATTAAAAAPTASAVVRDDFEGDVGAAPDQTEEFGRRQLARRERKAPAACVSAFRVPRSPYAPEESGALHWRVVLAQVVGRSDPRSRPKASQGHSPLHTWLATRRPG
jgi:hypothetical protein